MPRFEKPYYTLTSRTDKKITIDVTSSVSPGLPPHSIVEDEIIPWLRDRDANRILDFGAGALRHTFPFLDAGFEVCAVEFEETFARPACAEMLAKASKNANFSALVWPRDFLRSRRRFDAALLCYVLQVMPVETERHVVIEEIAKHLDEDGYLLYMSRFGQITADDAKHRVKDGHYRWPERELHTFYREFTLDETQTMFRRRGFTRIRSLGLRGTEQIYFYTLGDGRWI